MKMAKECPIEIPKDNPFQNDKLGREEYIEILSQFLLSFDQSIVICVDAPWGQGKTTFIKMLQQYLINQKAPTIYYNAWENDFSDDVLISLIGEVGLSINELTSIDSSKTKRCFEKVKKHRVSILKKSIPAAIKIASANIVSNEDASKLISTVIENAANEQIEKYEESKKSLVEFKNNLGQFAESFTSKEEHKPLVFIIDELDRCRPNFAIEVLEKAKHLFNVPNIRFVLATDKTQLGHSIKVIYGQDFDVNGYLRRFIDFDYLLPNPTKQDTYISYLFDKYKLLSLVGRGFNQKDLITPLAELIPAYNLTLREQESFFYIINFVLRTTKLDNKVYYLLLCFLIVLKIKRLDLYQELVSDKEKKIDAILQHIHQTLTKSNGYFGYNSGYVEMIIFYCANRRVIDREDNLVNIVTEYFKDFNIPKQKLDMMIKYLQEQYYGLDDNILSEFKKSIEISSNNFI